MTSMPKQTSMTLGQLSREISARLSAPELRGVWIVAETSDVATRSGHCYMELLEKAENGVTLAKARAAVWASTWSKLSSLFRLETGRELTSGMKVRVQVNVDYHAVYGFKLIVTGIDPAYTIGDALRRRQEILARLDKEGLLELNRQLPTPVPALRIAVISAPGAAGYGDFINQMLTNKHLIRFEIKLFEAVMQGDRTAPTIISALERISEEQEKWDIVVIIRGGGATSDLEAFDNYELAANIAGFPLPVIVGIGHERDVTVLDYVAHRRVKTPTAAAEWLISEATGCLDRLRTLGASLLLHVSDRIAGSSEQLSRLETLLTVAPQSLIDRADSRLKRDAMIMAELSSRVISPRLSYLDSMAGRLMSVVPNVISQRMARLDAINQMLALLSPEATLRRGYSITRLNGRAVSNPTELSQGDKIETTVLGGKIISTVN